jgi:hydroxymethylglutaryl-CoA synthase
MVGIVDYGFYLPLYRIKITEIASVWGKKSEDIQSTLNIQEKAVAGSDEDSLTMAYEAAAMAFSQNNLAKKIQAVLFGSETPAYAVNPTSTILAEFLGIEGNYFATDLQFACKAGTGGLITSFGLIESGRVDFVLTVAADKANGKPHDALEYTTGAGAVALIVGKDELILQLIDYQTFSSDTPDFWRRDGMRYPSHSGRFTGKPGYFKHIKSATEQLLKKTHLTPSQFKAVVFHMPNGKFPQQIALSLGFVDRQITPSLVVPYLGNSYTASALMGLMAVLDTAKPNDLILLTSYGSGAGADSFVFKVTKNINLRRKNFFSWIKRKKYINYPSYLKFTASF